MDSVEGKTADYYANGEKKKKSQHVREMWLSYSKGLKGKSPYKVISNKTIWRINLNFNVHQGICSCLYISFFQNRSLLNKMIDSFDCTRETDIAES